MQAVGQIGPLRRTSIQKDRIVCTVPAVKFVQRGHIFFLTAVPARHLLRVARVDHWESSRGGLSTNGYQRVPDAKRLTTIAKFIREPDAFFSTGGLLNARIPVGEPGSPIVFESETHADEPLQSGKLTLLEGEEPLWVVDMQHRLESLRKAITDLGAVDLEVLPIACTIASGLSRVEEINEFFQINTKQKKVTTALARRALALLSSDERSRAELLRTGRMWEARGPLIADVLMSHSPVWMGRIQPPNIAKRELPSALCKETSFVSSLKPVFEDPFLGGLNDRDLAAYVDCYWQGLRLLWPGAFAEPKRHVIQQNPGVVPLHRLMPRIFQTAPLDSSSPSPELIAKIASSWRSLGDKFWLKGGRGAGGMGSSEGAFKQIRQMLEVLLP